MITRHQAKLLGALTPVFQNFLRILRGFRGLYVPNLGQNREKNTNFMVFI